MQILLDQKIQTLQKTNKKYVGNIKVLPIGWVTLRQTIFADETFIVTYAKIKLIENDFQVGSKLTNKHCNQFSKSQNGKKCKTTGQFNRAQSGIASSLEGRLPV